MDFSPIFPLEYGTSIAIALTYVVVLLSLFRWIRKVRQEAKLSQLSDDINNILSTRDLNWGNVRFIADAHEKTTNELGIALKKVYLQWSKEESIDKEKLLQLDNMKNNCTPKDENEAYRVT